MASGDARSAQVANYLASRNSPMTSSAQTFVSVADRYRLDYRLLVAIAGKESSFGVHIPKNSFNAWGWGVPTGANKGIGFRSWDEGIETVGKGIREKYFDRGFTNLAKIEPIYTPPSAARVDHPWRTGVAQFMSDIERFR